MTYDHAPAMLNKVLTGPFKRRASGARRMYQFMVAGFIMAVGMSVAGAGTHLYQGFAKQQAMLRYDGKTYLASLGHLAVSFLCGPYIMLQLGWQHENGDTISIGSALITAAVGFSWAFITGMLVFALYFAVTAG